MESRPFVRMPRDLGRILLVLIIAAIVVCVAAIGYVLYTDTLAHEQSDYSVVRLGDTVLVNYTGMFSDGRVFDTSHLSIAWNDGAYPKSLTFTLRENSTYKPLEMEAGNYGEGGTIKGFALGVLGLSVGDTVTVEVPPGDGYPADPSMILTFPLEEHIQGTEFYTESEFVTYFNAQPELMRTYQHYFWTWDVYVANIEGGYVTVKHQPAIGDNVYPFGDPFDVEDPTGWRCEVVSFDTSADEGIGEIVIGHDLSEEDVYRVKGVDADGTLMIVSGLDSENETFSVHLCDLANGYNGEIAGRTLFFEIEIVKIEPDGN